MKSKTLLSALAVSALTLAACGAAPDSKPSGGPSASETAKTNGGQKYPDFLGCMVSDQGGFDDQSFNETSYKGLTRAVSELGIKKAEAQSQADADYAPNIASMVQQKCGIIVGVGFLLEDPIQSAAEKNPNVHFALVDSALQDKDFKPVTLPNVRPLVFNTAEAAFLAGYLAAGMSESGTVATFGGLPIPSVTIFMDGFADGVAKYNADKGKSVKLLGWDKAKQQGSFTNSFENQTLGQQLTEQFLAQGADIIMPVAGPVGLGAASAVKSNGKAKLIWVDTDGFKSTSYGSVILTSVIKKMDEAVFEAVKAAAAGKFSSQAYVGTLKNGGVDIAPYHDFDSKVPQELKAEVEKLKAAIISGELKVESAATPKS